MRKIRTNIAYCKINYPYDFDSYRTIYCMIHCTESACHSIHIYIWYLFTLDSSFLFHSVFIIIISHSNNTNITCTWSFAYTESVCHSYIHMIYYGKVTYFRGSLNSRFLSTAKIIIHWIKVLHILKSTSVWRLEAWIT